MYKRQVLALTSVTATTGATVNGRLFARNGAVTLDTNVITRSTCAVIAPGSTTTTSTTPGGATSTTIAGATTVPGGATTTIARSPNTPSTPSGGTTSQLPRTGSGTTDLVILAVLAIVAGAALLVLARHRYFRRE